MLKQKKDEELDNIVFLGLMPKSELPIWVQRSVATLFATLENEVQNACSPNKIFDSFAASIPIVQTSTGWIHDLVKNEKCGVNVCLETPKNTADQLISLTNDTVLCKQLGENALRLAQTTFNRDLLADKYLEIMKDIIDE